ncbi:ribonuclease P protein subunit p25-like protein [Erpetoichthys calabaricus]|uniref:ribonuclease P protein subunit p25-like protein n=1 Tax=Erpetoichthys calabaricus TaxID=27687 RepID=UPI00109FAFF6|nr:ribonuclease P protein subunit p25-like protein [Erpetoichthys calabaricus]XP_051791803.1 ribonuclease P protein subunit p25-like protein [Erpetoichthys calabaricus]XP_051791804.1 ribonuclease P protein subunit p25-like protein [Erpetoichthys calabaricus]
MENYKKIQTTEKPCPMPFQELPSDTPEMKVKDGSKIRNLVGFAIRHMEKEEARCIVFTGSGNAVCKAISCVEILKQHIKGLHQVTKLLYKLTEELWEPLEPTAGLDSLTVKRNVPAIYVLLSKDPLDVSESGYQAPGCFSAFWAQTLKDEESQQGQRRKRQAGVWQGKGGKGKYTPQNPGNRGEPVKKTQGRGRPKQ